MVQILKMLQRVSFSSFFSHDLFKTLDFYFVTLFVVNTKIKYVYMLQNFALTKFPNKNVLGENMATSRTTQETKSSMEWEKCKYIRKEHPHF